MAKCFYCGTDNSENDKYCRQCGNGLQSVSTSTKSDTDIEMMNKHLFPKFILEKRIGRGGMATVYLGEQSALQRKIVVKILNVDISEDEEIRERFILEARTPARLRHPNLVEVIDVGLCEERPYYIMEYAPGGSLADKQKKYRDAGIMFPLREAVEIITKILDALHYCHNNGLQSHRDIKPANIMFRDNGEPIIVDFGIAKLSDASITKTRMTMGTANYMSPEQCQGRKDIDGRSDVYSVGIMLFELLTGELPFKGDSGLSIMIKQVKEKLPSLTTRVKTKIEKPDQDFSKLGPELEAIIEKACSKSRKKRYQSAKEFAEALAGLVGTDIPFTLKQQNYHTPSVWGLVFAMLLLGLGIGGFVGYKLLFINKDKDKPVVEDLIPDGNIIIESDPVGAKVINALTDAEEGVTPFHATKSQVGIYKYKLVLEGYKDQFVEVVLQDINSHEKELYYMEPLKDLPPLIEGTDKKPPVKTDKVEAKDPVKDVPPVKTTDEVNTSEIDNGLVSVNGLVWQTSGIKLMNWYSAVAYCRNLGMKLPSRSELKVAYNSGNKKLYSPCCEYWSSTPHEDYQDMAYTVTMKGFDSFISSKYSSFYVRCVTK